MSQREEGALPVAVLKPAWFPRRALPSMAALWWAFPAMAALLVFYLVLVQPLLYPAVNVIVQFRQGAGVAQGDKVRFLGVDLGRVERVALKRGADSGEWVVEAGLNLDGEYLHLLAEDSLFWVERPVVGLSGVRGLDTLTKGTYIGFRPGLSERRSGRFLGSMEPPPTSVLSPDGLRIILESQEKAGLIPGSSVSFRGFQVGQIETVSLSRDSAVVESSAYIFPEFKNLIRANTVFWPMSSLNTGAEIFGFKTLQFDLNLPGLGGVALSTPTNAGPMARQGDRFTLKPQEEAKKKQETWLAFRPNIPLGQVEDGGAAEQIPLRRLTLKWLEPGKLWGKNRREAAGWTIEAEPGLLLAPEAMMHAAMKGEDLALQMDGRVIKGTECSITGDLFLKMIRFRDSGMLPADRPIGEVVAELFQGSGDLADCSILYRSGTGDGRVQGALVRREKLSHEGGAWRIGPEVPVPPGSEHAPVINPQSGKIIGFLGLDDNGYLIRRRP